MKALRILGLALLITCTVIIQTFSAGALSASYYNRLFDRLEVHRTVGVSPERIREVGIEIVDYLDHRLPSLDTRYFNEREIHHMEDVRGLFAHLKIANALSLIASLTALTWIWRNRSRRDAARTIFMGMIAAILLSAGVALFLIFGDFEPAFIRFHEIFFNNDLWILNPATDRLIQMMPLDFFIAFVRDWVIRIAATFAALLIASGSYCFFVRRTR